MVSEEKDSERLIQHLKDLRITLLSDWDVLVFLYRHQTSLASVGQIARLTGYPAEIVVEALDRLESYGLIKRSRASRAVRLYQFVDPEAHLPQSRIRQLMTLAQTRTGRLLLTRELKRQPIGLHLKLVQGKEERNG